MSGAELPGLCITLWSDDGLRAALARAESLLQSTQPPAVCLHARPQGLREDAVDVARQVRELVPHAEVWLGIAADAGFFEWRDGAMSDQELHARRVSVADVAAAVGTIRVEINAEKRYKRDPAKPRQGTGMFDVDACREWVRDMRAVNGALVVSHSAYQRPMAHRSYRGWLGFLGSQLDAERCDETWSQVYWAPKKGSAPQGVGPVFQETHAKSFDRAIREGIISPRVIERAYLQTYRCHPYDLSRVADRYASAKWWAWPGSAQPKTTALIRSLSLLDRLGYRGAGRLERLQRDAALKVDAKLGPKTAEVIDALARERRLIPA